MRQTLLGIAAIFAAWPAWAGVGAWTELPSPSGSDTIRVLGRHPTNASIRYVAAQGGMFVSSDAGQSWARRISGIVPTPAGYYSVNDLAISGGSLYITPHYLQKSIDGGTNWQRTGWETENPQALVLAATPADPSTVYAGSNRGIYKSTDGGASWRWLHGSLPVYAVAVDPNNSNTVFRAVETGIFRSLDGGLNWNQVSTTLTSVKRIVVDPNNAMNVYVGTNGSGVYKSTDGGATYNAINRCLPNKCVPPTLNTAWVNSIIVEQGNAPVVYLGATEGLYKSTDGGANWSQANMGPLGITTMMLDPVNRDTVIAAWGNKLYSYSFPADVASDWERLFNWAQATYPQYFSPPCSSCTQSIEGLRGRYYAGTGNYVWTIGGEVYVYGAAFGGVLRVGLLSEFMPLVIAAGF